VNEVSTVAESAVEEAAREAAQAAAVRAMREQAERIREAQRKTFKTAVIVGILAFLGGMVAGIAVK
jgi:hypothetical protein